MKWLLKFAAIVVANSIALWVAHHYIVGFNITGTIIEYVKIGGLLTVLGLFAKPLLKLVLSPIIILTFGLALIAINALLLYVLDILSKNLTIDSIEALVLGTLVISAVNFVFNLIFR